MPSGRQIHDFRTFHTYSFDHKCIRFATRQLMIDFRCPQPAYL